jgi:hypothetical protein
MRCALLNSYNCVTQGLAACLVSIRATSLVAAAETKYFWQPMLPIDVAATAGAAGFGSQ